MFTTIWETALPGIDCRYKLFL